MGVKYFDLYADKGYRKLNLSNYIGRKGFRILILKDRDYRYRGTTISSLHIFCSSFEIPKQWHFYLIGFETDFNTNILFKEDEQMEMNVSSTTSAFDMAAFFANIAQKPIG